MTISEKTANAIYDILVETCGAGEGIREDFVTMVVYRSSQKRSGDDEFRFQGQLGFGGKFYHGSNGWRVSCYREDETPETLSMINAANAKLKALLESQ